MYTQLCDLSNNNAWDTEKAVIVRSWKWKRRIRSFRCYGDTDGNDAPWVVDSDLETWEDFLGSSSAPREQLVLLDKDLNKRYQFQYPGSGISPSREVELIEAINLLIDEFSMLQGDMNEDSLLNVLDVIIIVNMAIGNLDVDLNGDMNNDGGINILDVVILANIILANG